MRPILNIIPGCYPDELFIEIRNNGVGPATITSFLCKYTGNMANAGGEYSSLDKVLSIEGMTSALYLESCTFLQEIVGNTISAEKYVNLIHKKKQMRDLEIFSLSAVLKDIEIVVEYEDIYRNKFSIKKRLDFFSQYCDSAK